MFGPGDQLPAQYPMVSAFAWWYCICCDKTGACQVNVHVPERKCSEGLGRIGRVAVAECYVFPQQPSAH